MTLTSAYFIAFVVFGLVVHHVLPLRFRNGWLLFLSIFFVCSYSIPFGIFLAFFSTLLYFTALAVERGKNHRGYLLYFAIICIAILFIFFSKFSYLLEGLNVIIKNWKIQLPLDLQLILIPVGVSFLALQAIAYLVDVHQRRIPAQRSWVKLTLFLFYFPKILAGPIERPGPFFKKIGESIPNNEERFWRNSYLIFIGLVRKILIADPLMAMLPNNTFTVSSTTMGFQALFSLLAFGIGLYNDFAGYSDIARGISGMFGIDLAVNFRYPFLATSFSDFWRRWHISLSDFLRDYLYYPFSRFLLKRNPDHTRLVTILLPPLVTMLISGLWHGISWAMLLWGGLHGLLLAVERLLQVRSGANEEQKPIWKKAISTAVVFVVITLLWIPFRAGLAGGWAFLRGLFSGYDNPFVVTGSLTDFFVAPKPAEAGFFHLFLFRGWVLLAFAIVLDLILAKGGEDESMMHWPVLVRIAVLALLTIALLLFSTGDTLKLFVYQGF